MENKTPKTRNKRSSMIIPAMVKKRDGRIVKFDQDKITKAIFKAMEATKEGNKKEARALSDKVVKVLAKRFDGKIAPSVEEIQDIVEETLLSSVFRKAAKAYIIYRDQHTKIREIRSGIQVDLVDEYLNELDWQVKENSNMSYSLQGLNNYLASEVSKTYWLNKIYPPEIKQAYLDGDFHIHDLGMLSVYTYYGKEVVIVKTKGLIKLISFENLYDLIEKRERLINEKERVYAKYPKDIYVLDKNSWTKVKRVTRKVKNRKMRFIKNRGGRSVIVTDNHPMITEAKEKIAAAITEKDKLFTVDLNKLLQKEKLFYIDEIDLLKEIIVNKNKWEDSSVYFNGVLLENISLNEKNNGILHTTQFNIPRKIKLTEKFGYFVGLTLAEGYLSYNKKSPRTISLSQKDKKLLLKANEGLLDNEISGWISKNKNQYELQIKNPFLKFLFQEVFKIKTGSKNKTLPVDVSLYNKDFVKGMLGGLIDGDGSIETSKTVISLRISSRAMLEQCYVILSLLGFSPRDRDLEGQGTVRFYKNREIRQNYPLYGVSFRKIRESLPSEKYKKAKLSKKAWQDETRDSWHIVLNNKGVNIPDDFIYDITTESSTLVVNGMWNHNCVGWDLQDLLLTGFKGVPGKIESKPAKHFRAALGQVVNFLYTLQGEAAGAQAFSNFDTLLAPFIRYDNLSYKEVRQAMQEFIFNMNVPTRVGFQTPYTNLTFDLIVPEIYADQAVIIGGEMKNITYSDFQKEMDMLNRAFLEVMTEGDAKGRVFTFPIPTYNITKDFDWNNPIVELLDEVTAKYGLPYFSNFISSDMKPSDVRSMCCRLRLDLTELRKRGGGYFGANPLTGSIGVVTINMPRIGYLSKNKKEFLERLNSLMILAKNSLEIKRKVLERFTDKGLYPYTKFYLREVKKRFDEYWKNHFSTIGLLGMNEACLNLFGKNIASPEGQEFSEEVLEFMRNKMLEFQKETENIYNLEATPAEGSLAPDEKVLISQSDPKLTEIGPLIDNYLTQNRQDIYLIGRSEVLKIPYGEMFTYGFSMRDLKIRKYPVTALVRHQGRSMYQIKTVSGRNIKVTGQHSLFTLRSGQVKECLVREIKKGDRVAIPKRIEMEDAHKILNLIDIFKNSEFRNKLYGIFPLEFVQKLIDRADIKKWSQQYYTYKWKDVRSNWKRKRVIPLRLIYDLNIKVKENFLKSSQIFYRLSKNAKPINALIKINKDFGFVIGSLLAEGWISQRPEFTNTNQEVAKEFLKAAKRVFGQEAGYLSSQKRKDGRKTRYVVYLNSTIGYFLKEVEMDRKSDKKKIPAFIFFSSTDCIIGLIRGFHLGDGSIYRNREKHDFSVRLYTNSHKLAEGLNLCLLRMRILAKIRCDRKSKYNPLWKDNYILSITGASNLKRYFWLIFNKKIEVSNIHSAREIIPGVSQIIKSIMKRHSIKPEDLEISKDSFNRNVRESRISIQFLRQIVTRLTGLINDEDFLKIKILLNSDIYWDAVKEIKKIDTPQYVYDLEVDIHSDLVNNFLGGEGLVCLHNTSYRLALKDKKKYPDTICANEEEYKKGAEPFYTNSSQLPVNYTDDIFEALDLQDPLQIKYSGGTTVHLFLGERIDDSTVVKNLVKKICEKYRLPYFTITPTFSICPVHGYISGEHYVCPKCGEECEVYSRPVGYLRPVKQWNKGKEEEFKERKTFNVNRE